MCQEILLFYDFSPNYFLKCEMILGSRGQEKRGDGLDVARGHCLLFLALGLCNITILREMQIKTRGYHFTHFGMTIIKETTNDKCLLGCGESRTFMY